MLGMHRSGTSLVAGILDLLGVHMGPEERFIPPDELNPKGYWEHRDIVELNDELLARLGGGWDHPPEMPEAWEADPALDDLRERAEALVKEDFDGLSLWGWKDPRACLTLPFWQSVLPPMRYVVCARTPLAAARSVGQTAKVFGRTLSTETGLDLWSAYVSAALENTHGQPRLFLTYEDIVTDPLAHLDSLCAFIGRPQAAGDADLRRAVEGLADPGLHRQRVALGGSESPLDAWPLEAMYLILQLQAPGEIPGALEQLARQSRAARSLLFDARDQAPREWELARGREMEMQSRIRELTHRLLYAELTNAEVLAMRDELSSLHTELAAASDLARDLEQAFQAREAELRAELTTAWSRTSELNDIIESVRSSWSWRLTRPLRALRRSG